jgi:O-antigen ligase
VLAALVIAVLRDADVLPGRVLLTAPLLLTILTAVWMTVRLGSSTDPQYGSFKLQLFVAENLAFLVAGVVVAARRDQFRLFLVLTLAMAGLSAIVLARGLAAGNAQAVVGGRFAISSDYNPIIFGRDAARAMTIAVFFLLVARLPWLRLVSIALLPLLAVAFTASGSRGPTVGLIVGLALLLGLTLRDRDARRRVLLVFAGGIAGAFLVSQLVPGQNVSRALSFLTGNAQDASSNGRTGLWHAAWHAFAGHPLWGIGTGSFGSIDPVNLYPHNLVLETLAEQGIVGGLLVVGTIVLGAAALWRLWREADGRDRHDAAMTASLLAAAVVNAMLSGDIAVNNAVWLALGLGTGLRLRARGLPAVPGRIAALRGRRALPRAEERPQQRRQAPAAVGGRILEPRAGETISGVVTAVVEPARTGRPVELVRLEWTTGAVWVDLAEADERTYELELEGGGMIVRSRRAAELVAARLGASIAPSQRRPWSAWRRVELRFDAALLESDGWLRAVTVDAGGVETPTEAVELSVDARAPAAAPAPPPEAVPAAWAPEPEAEPLPATEEPAQPPRILAPPAGVVGGIARLPVAGADRFVVELQTEGGWRRLADGADIDTRGLPDGPHRIRVVAADGTPSEPAQLVVDNEPPAVHLLEPAAGAVLRGVVDLVAVAEDAGSGAGSILFQRAREDGAWRPVAGSRWDTTADEDGAWRLRAIAADRSGHVGESAVVEVAVANHAAVLPEPAVVVRRRPSRPTLGQLEAAIDANPSLPDDHVYALEAVLYYLRDYADFEGNLPPEFDGLVEQEFGELLGAVR